MTHSFYPWTVVGAGPAGIAAVGKLLDLGVREDHILWIDPAFYVGDLGQKWSCVSSNTTVDLFRKFLNACASFRYETRPVSFELDHLPAQDTCILKAITDPLQWVTNHLRKRISSRCGWVTHIGRQEGTWTIICKENSQEKTISTERLILAIGSEPRVFDIPSSKKRISLPTLLDPAQLTEVVSSQDTIAVFGSSHTAIIALYQLVELGIPVINFYRSPLKYAHYYEDWILYDNTGLKGYSAQWARENLQDRNLPDDRLPLLERIHVADDSFQEKYEACTHVVQAIGFKPRDHILSLEGTSFDFSYDDQTGIMGPGLYGVGIAFPQGHRDRAGNYEHRVGLWKFMDHLNQVLPLWISSVF